MAIEHEGKTMATTRRTLIATALATTVTAAPALALVAAAIHPPDPVFAALDAQRKADAAFRAACEERNAAASSLPLDVTREPRVKYSRFWDQSTDVRGDLFAYCHNEIDRLNGYYEETREKFHTALDADAAELERAQESAGLTAKMEAVSVASDAESVASMALLYTVPTTIAGVVAALEYHNRPFMPGTKHRRDPDEHIATIIRGLKSLA
jgi:hypothetical protein